MPGIILLALATTQGIARHDLDDPAMLHDGQPVAHMRHHREVMADHHIGQIMFGAQIGQQIEDLGLYADVQRACRFIQQKQPGLCRQSARDRHRWRCPPDS